MATNAIDFSGLQIQSLDDILNEILNGTADYPGMYAIYGADISVASNSPDGQMLHIFAQAKLDTLELVQQVYNSMDPDTAVGVSLDQRCAINGVFRRSGTYSTQNVSVTVSGTVTLAGLDTAPAAPFTVADGAGNQLYLIATTTVSAGAHTLNFRAANLGPTVYGDNSVTVVVTLQAGVTSVTNGTLSSTKGVAEESDYSLRVRRSRSIAMGGKGYLAGLYSVLLGLPGVTALSILENTGSVTDANGLGAHSIWVIIQGGAGVAIGLNIYAYRNAGCGMKGSESEVIVQLDGSNFTVYYDRPTTETLWIQLNMTAVTGIAPDAAFIRAQLVAQLSYDINQPADASAITTLLKSIAPNCYFDSVNVSNTNGSYIPFITNTAVNYIWALAVERIYVNGTLS